MADNGRMMDNGTVVFPKRGSPPPLREGYVRDKSDPWTMHPVFPECALRSEINSKVPCNRSPDGWRIVTQISCAAGQSATYLNCCECIVEGKQSKFIQIHAKKPTI